MELDLYKFLQSSNVSYYEVAEWGEEVHYLVWLYYCGIADFANLMEKLGADLSTGGCDAKIQSDGICVDLNDYYLDDIDLDKVFEMEED